MAQPATSVSTATKGNDKSIDWAALRPGEVDYEDALNSETVKKTWAKMYRLGGLNSPNEQTQAAFRLAVYVYACKNGTSRAGNYRGMITMADGNSFPASVILEATGKMAVRKFFRGNMVESYKALKQSGAMEQDERFVARVADLQISADCAFAVADWLSGCPGMTPAESAAHAKSLEFSLSRARRARGGHSLEDEEEKVVHKGLEAQGSFEPSGQNIVF